MVTTQQEDPGNLTLVPCCQCCLGVILPGPPEEKTADGTLLGPSGSRVPASFRFHFLEGFRNLFSSSFRWLLPHL